MDETNQWYVCSHFEQLSLCNDEKAVVAVIRLTSQNAEYAHIFAPFQTRFNKGTTLNMCIYRVKKVPVIFENRISTPIFL